MLGTIYGGNSKQQLRYLQEEYSISAEPANKMLHFMSAGLLCNKGSLMDPA